jgi:SOS-response transcriptional repressor LexA
MKEDEDELAAAWLAFVGEARALTGANRSSMMPEAVERLETLSDPFIHLVGHVESSEVSPAARRRSLADDDPRGDGLRLDGETRRGLRRRILAGLHAQRLRVSMPQETPLLRPLDRATPVEAAFLEKTERAHEAVFVPELAIAAGAGHELWESDCETLIPLSSDIPRGQYLALKVAGDSMEPMLHSGDVVLVRLGAEPLVGRVVVARDPDHGYVVKEVGRMTPDGIELRSLNPSFAPLVVPQAPTTVLGTVLLRWCSHGSRRTSALRSEV